LQVTDDAFLGGGIQILQPRQGYRAGLDAVMLAAAVPARGDEAVRVIDAGAGVGTAGLCLAWRCRGADIVLAEREPELVALARENIHRNGFDQRVSVAEIDIARAAPSDMARCGLGDGTFDAAIANPPFHAEGAGTAARSALKAAAHAMADDALDDWARFLARMVRPGGAAFVIHKASALPDLLAVLQGRFGGVSVLPLHSHAGEAAGRVIVSGVKGSRAPFRIEPGIVLHEADERFTAGAEAVLRLGQPLSVAYGRVHNADAVP
jgi:tRNA1(Val) A37 N6-methylase TrmN6